MLFQRNKLVYFLLICVLSHALKGKAQDTSYVIIQSQKTAFYTLINDTLIHSKVKLSDTLRVFRNAEITLIEDTTLAIGNLDFQFKKNTVTRYQTRTKGQRIYFLEIGQESSVSKQLKKLVFKQDSLDYQKGTALIQKAKESLSGGLIGCENPMSKIKFGLVIKDIDSQLFTSTRLNYLIKEFKKDDICFFSEQFHQLFEYLEFDDQKLELAKMANHKIFDPLNIDDYNFEFLIDNNLDKFKLLVEEWKKL